MNASPPDNASMSSFLDDYFAECDEHLTAVRRHVLALEASLGQVPPDRSCVDELFRSFHTIKGLSGMVGIKEAEHLAHRIESYLGALRDKKVSLSPETLDTLIAGVNLLEKIIVAKRSNRPLPAIEEVTERLAGPPARARRGTIRPGPQDAPVTCFAVPGTSVSGTGSADRGPRERRRPRGDREELRASLR